MVPRIAAFCRPSRKSSTGFFAPLVKLLAMLVIAPLLQSVAASQATESVLYSFNGSTGSDVWAGLISDRAGNLYGASGLGGANGDGTVFELMPNNGAWIEITLHNFAGPDGMSPFSSLTFDPAGNLYGTTVDGGASGGGTVFKLTPSGGLWVETVLYSFAGGVDGAFPNPGVIFDGSGNLYGTTSFGGVDENGTVFELMHSNGSWKETVLHSFTGTDGSNPYAGLIFDSVGDLYGTTFSGGADGDGAVFELMPKNGTWTEVVLHSFAGLDGENPYASLIFDLAGNLYGTTVGGGASGGGTAFELTPLGGIWTETVLWSFVGVYGPEGAVIFDKAGNLYGTTLRGGTDGTGTVFELTPSGGGWTETVLHNFTSTGGDGLYPHDALIFDSAGNLYGTTAGGGAAGDGVAFEITPLRLIFPVRKSSQCGNAACTPQNAPINTVFDHNMLTAYECSSGAGGYGSIIAFTDESASVQASGKGYGACGKLYGYTNPNIASFLDGYTYTGGGVLYYDSHPGIDYNFPFGTPLYPALNGCVTYFQGAAGVPSPEKGHVMAIIPQPTEPAGGCENAVNATGYDVIYMHLSSYYDQSTKQVMRCTSSKASECDSGQAVEPCPTCAQQYEWVSTTRTSPIGYSGNFFVTTKVLLGWGGVGSHLHFEVDQVLGTAPRGVDPYGWCGAPGTDPYTGFTGLVNTNLWSQFSVTCPGGQQ
jgi:uncharacterized repeat protein (TIGR03803 family)